MWKHLPVVRTTSKSSSQKINAGLEQGRASSPHPLPHLHEPQTACLSRLANVGRKLVSKLILCVAVIAPAVASAQDFSATNTTIAPSQIPLGGNGSVSVDVTRNTGSGATTLTIALPPQVTAGTPLPAGCTLAAPNVQCTVNPAANLSSVTITIPLVGATTGGFTINSSVTDGGGGTAGNNNTSGTGSVIAAGDLQVSKVPHPTGSPAPATYPAFPAANTFLAGSLMSYTIRPSIASGSALPAGETITVTDNLPAGTEFQYISTTSGPWTCSGSGPVSCTITGPQPVGALPEIVINGRIIRGSVGDFDNNVSIAATSTGYGDPNTTNNGPFPVKVTVGPGADLTPTVAITPTPPGGLVAAGDATRAVRLTLNNNGPFAVTGGTVATSIPAGFTISSLPAGCVAVPNNVGTVLAGAVVVTCTAGTLASSGNQQFNIPVVMPATPTSVTLNANSNIPAGATPTGIQDSDNTNNTASVNFNVVPPASDLSIGKTNNTTGPIGPGGNYTSTFTVNNLGPSDRPYSPANPIVVVDTVNSAVVAAAAATAGYTCANPVANRVVCTTTGTGTLAAGSSLSFSATLTFTSTPPGAPTPTSNTACTGSTGEGQAGLPSGSPPDPTTDSNDCTGAVGGPVFTQVGSPVTTVKQVLKTNPGFAGAGWTAAQTGANRLLATENSFFWRIAATVNAGGSGGPVPTLVLTDNINTLASSPFVTPVTIVETVPAGGTCSYTAPIVTCTFTNVAAGTTVGAVVRVDRAVQDGTFTNTVNTSSPDAVLSGTVTANAQIEIDPVAEIEVTGKSVAPNPALAGQLTTFSISTRNNGPSTAATVTLADNIDTTKYEIVDATFGAGGTPCTISATNPTVSCALGNMALGAVTTTTITVRPITPFPGAPAYPIAESNTATATTPTCQKLPPSPAGTADTVTSCNLPAALANDTKTAAYQINAQRFDLQTQKQNVVSTTGLPAALAGYGDPVKFRFRAQNLASSSSRAERVRLLDVLDPPDNTYTYTSVTVSNVNAASASPPLVNDTTKTNATVQCTLRAGTASDTCGVNAAGKQVLDCTLAPGNAGFLDPSRAVNFEVALAYTKTGSAPFTPSSHSDTLNICADVSQGGLDVDNGNNQATTSVTVLPQVDWGITKTTVTAQPVGINQPVQYDLVLRNTGLSASQQVRVSDVLPPNFELITTGPNAPAVVLGSFVTASPSTATGATVACTPTPATITAAGQNQTVNCVVNATPGPLGTGAFPGSTNAANTITVRIWARAKEGFFTGPYLNNRTNNATVSVGQDSSGNPLAFDTGSGNNTAASDTQVTNTSLAGRVFLDRNGNGVQDGTLPAQDEGIGNVTVTLNGTDAFGNTITRTLTTVNTVGATRGDYLFDNLPPGTYTVTETQSTVTPATLQNSPGTPTPAGAATAGTYANGGQSGDSTWTGVVLNAGQNATNYNFPEIQGATLSGIVYHDLNNNGVRDAGEPGIGGVQVCLTGNTIASTSLPNPTCTTTSTAPGTLGEYSFTGLPPSDAAGYTVTETTQPAGYFDGKENAGGTTTATIVAGSQNGAGATNYTASGVAPGFTLGSTDRMTGVVVNPGANLTNYNFGEILPAQISGTVFIDRNNDGSLAAGETGRLANVNVTITGTDINGNAVSRTVQTTATGDYSFPGLMPGRYNVVQAAVPAYQHTGQTANQGGTGTFGASPVTATGGLGPTFTTGAGTAGTPAATARNIDTIAVGPGGNSPNNNFGEQGARIAGRVYEDVNNNGVYNVGTDTPLSGVVVVLTGTDANGGTVNRTATTNGTGDYVFDDLPLAGAGGYTITRGGATAGVQPIVAAGVGAGRNYLDRTATVGTTYTGTAPATPQNVGNAITGIAATNIGTATFFGGQNFDFGLLRPSSIAGIVYTENGTTPNFQTGELLISGVTVTLTGTDYRGQPVTVTPQVTTGAGAYIFNDLPPGTYRITETQPAGYGQNNAYPGTVPTGAGGSAGTPSGTDVIQGIVIPTANPGQALTNYNFGEVLTNSNIAGRVYFDVNQNGVYDPGEPGIPGVTMTLTGTNLGGQPVNVSVTTDANGQYVFPNVPYSNAAGYTVTETQPPNYQQGQVTTPTGTVTGPDTVTGIVVSAPGIIQPINFGEFRPSTIAGRVYVDANNNGVFDPGDAPIPGTVVFLNGPGGQVQTVTDAQGQYIFNNLQPGTYTVTEQQPIGYGDRAANPGSTGGTAGTNTITNIVLPLATDSVNNNFGEVLGSIAGVVYQDTNNNGVRDPGEPPIPGVTVRLTGTNTQGQTVNLTAVTDATGAYRFDDLFPPVPNTGYTLTETQPAGFSDGRETVGSVGGTLNPPDSITNIQLPAGANATGYNFGELTGASLSGQVYEDVNNSGTRDAGDRPIAGVTVRLTGTDVNGNPVNLTTTTDASGAYRFDNLQPGTYTVTEVQPANFVDGVTRAGTSGGTVANNAVSAITLRTGDAATGYDFGELLPASISGVVYVDTNDNGTRDAGEAPIPGTTITLTGTDDRGTAVNRTTTTDANGNYTFDNLRPGTYVVTETQPQGFTDGKDAVGSLGGTLGSDTVTAIPVRQGDQGTGYNFGERPGGLSGRVYVDSNGNGRYDPGEPGIPGVQIAVTGTSATGQPVNVTVTTGPDGVWSAGVPASNPAGYTIRETQPTAYADGGETVGSLGGTASANDTFTGVVVGGTAGTEYNFGERGATIAGQVWNDRNDNGTRDPDEVGIPGVTVTLTGTDSNGNPVIRTTTTDRNGQYRFVDLPTSNAAGYTITETQPAGYTDGRERVGSLGGTTPSNDNFRVPVTVPGSNGTGYDFGEKFDNPASLSGRVWVDSNHNRVNDEPPSAGQQSWIVQITQPDPNNPGGVIVVATTTTDANGNYRFDGLVPGSYDIRFVHPTTGRVWGGAVSPTPGAITDGTGIRNLTLNPGTNLVQQNLPIDPAGVIFDTTTRAPVGGATVAFTGPAGFNPAIHLPDGRGTQTVGPDGFYQFLLLPGAPAGVYTITVTPPANYVLTQTPQTGPLNTINCPVDPNPVPPCLVNPAALPSGNTSNIYFNTFTLGPGSQDVIHNHIGLDPIAQPTTIEMRKVTPKLTVVRGELVPYTITARNTRPVAVNNITLVDTIPPGFRYVAGSATIQSGSGAVTNVTPAQNGLALSIAGQNFAAGEIKTIKMLLVVGAGVGEGEYVNQVQARFGTPTGAPVSNLATASVRVVPDAVFDCTDIIGKVYDDRNANGYQDEGEPGLKGVRVVTVRGQIITTDAEGRYHVACADIPQQDIGANFVLKLDERSLPSGYRVTTDNPMSERITRGKIVKMNFGATIHRVIRVDLAPAAFDGDSNNLRAEFAKRVDNVIELLRERPSVLRLAYAPGAEDSKRTDERVAAIKKLVWERWATTRKKAPAGEQERMSQYNLDIEVEIVRNVGAAAGGAK